MFQAYDKIILGIKTKGNEELFSLLKDDISWPAHMSDILIFGQWLNISIRLKLFIGRKLRGTWCPCAYELQLLST